MINLICPICRASVGFESLGKGEYTCPCGAAFNCATLKWRVAERPFECPERNYINKEETSHVSAGR